MTKTLIATLGLSPGVVTGAYFSLAREGQKIDKVITVTTNSAATRQCEQMIWETLEQSANPPSYQPIRPINDSELGETHATYKLAYALLEQIQSYVGESEVYLVLTGGRTSMAAAMILATQRLEWLQPGASAGLHLLHVEVIDKDLDENGHISRLAMMAADERMNYLAPLDTAVKLIEIPLFDAGQKVGSFQKERFLFAIGAYLAAEAQFQNIRYFASPDYLQGIDGMERIDLFAERRTGQRDTSGQSIDRPKLRRLMTEAFSINDLKEICFDLELDHEEFDRRIKTNFVIELILLFERTERIPELVAECENRRPHLDWQQAAKVEEFVELVLCTAVLQQNEEMPLQLKAEDVTSIAGSVDAAYEFFKRPVAGWLVTNAATADSTAVALAAASNVTLWRAPLPGDWRERADWRIAGALQPLTAVGGGAGGGA